jgi:peptide/nickel transport system substrate-binding protein
VPPTQPPSPHHGRPHGLRHADQPNAEGAYEPWLAESVESNADGSVWTFKLRQGIKFHDGTDLDATVVKNNLDAYRVPHRSPAVPVRPDRPVEVVDPRPCP